MRSGQVAGRVNDLFADNVAPSGPLPDGRGTVAAGGCVFGQQSAAECSFEDFDGGGVARVEFDQPRNRKIVGEDEVDAEQAAQLGFVSQRVAESLQQFASLVAHGDRADGTGVAEHIRCAERGADELFADANQFHSVWSGDEERGHWDTESLLLKMVLF